MKRTNVVCLCSRCLLRGLGSGVLVEHLGELACSWIRVKPGVPDGNTLEQSCSEGDGCHGDGWKKAEGN